MENFKSFGRKMSVPILEGYTAVTGPNGSGKSNISDAILFVLGPRSAKAIRAGKLTDLLYNGGKEGKPQQYCQVSLVFDNKDRAIPYDADDITLTRYVALSPSVEGGYNSYFYINDKKSSLTEFEDLLAHARISADGYNIVQQGDVTRIVQMGSVDRRRLVDSMAGITKYDEDIAGADRKRTEVEADLHGIEIVLTETKKRMKELERHRGDALKYKELKERLEKTQAQLAWKERQLDEEQIRGIRERLDRYEKEKAALAAKAEKVRARVVELDEALKALDAEMAQKGGQEFASLRKKVEDLKVQRETQKHVIETSQEQAKALKDEEAPLRKERAKVEAELKELEASLAAADKELGSMRDGLKGKEAELSKLQDAASKTDAALATIQQEVAKLDAAARQAEELAHQHTLEADRLREAAERARGERAQAEEALKRYRLELDDVAFQIKNIQEAAKGSTKTAAKLREQLDAKRKEESDLTRRVQELEEAVRSLTREYTALKAQSEAAESLRKGYTLAVTSLLEARDQGSLKGIHGTVAELGKVEKKYERAVATAAGGRLQAVIVEDDAVAAHCIEHLRKHHLGRATFLPLNKMLPGNPRGKALLAVKESLGFAIDLVKFGDKYRNAFWYVLGDTIVVDTLDKARQLMGGVRLVTLGGDLIEASGAMIGGEPEQQLLAFGGEPGQVDALAAKLRDARAQADQAAQRLGQVRKELADLEEQSRAAGSGAFDSTAKVETLDAQRAEFQAKVKSLQSALDDATKRAEEAEQKLRTVEKAAAEAKNEAEQTRAKREARAKAAVEATPQRVAKQLKALQEERTTLLDTINAKSAEREGSQAKRAVAAQRRDELDGRLKTIAGQLKALADRAAAAERTLAQAETELRALEKMEHSMDAALQALTKKKEDTFQERTKAASEVEKVQGQITTKDDFSLKERETLAEAEGKLRTAEERAKQFPEVKGDLPPLQDLEKAEREVEAQMKAMGDVNMLALEDYDAQDKRSKELGEELKRLEEQRKQLVDLAVELNEKKKEGFGRVFTAINENFKTVYAELSDGGEAQLVLENEKEPFQGGLLMKVKPPHKKAMMLQALSGGEKSLVSMAFIFAIQQHEPSPFYLLDEVDQNLDAVNAERVAAMIKKNSRHEQFVQITLRKVTLKEADHVVGVTMGSDGQSQLIMKVNLDEVPDDKAAAEAAA